MDEPNKKEEELLEGADEAKKLAETEAKAEEYLAGWQRAKADFANYKKDEIQRFEEFAKYSSADLIKEFINVLDSFDLAIAALQKNGPVEKGVYMIRTQIEDILEKRGVEKIGIKIGSDFDPGVSEAIAVVESEEPEGKVLEEIEAGYRLYGKVLRPARVTISKGPKTASGGQ
jgi:molecular chaperone GrpE